MKVALQWIIVGDCPLLEVMESEDLGPGKVSFYQDLFFFVQSTGSILSVCVNWEAISNIKKENTVF